MRDLRTAHRVNLHILYKYSNNATSLAHQPHTHGRIATADA